MGDGPRDSDAVRRNRELQRRFYGEPLGDRLRRLLGALDISQAVLAETLGLSSAMLSQLISARRVKIGTPAVLGRLVLLEQRILAGDGPTDVGRLLAEVRASQPRSGPPAPRSADSYELLRTVADPDELARAADTLDGGFPSLAGLLRRAADQG
ncbi:helix-turn-helix domain-containing protein [Actinomycetospora sp. C-140]